VTVSANRWYHLRLEVVGNHIRALVNCDLKVETSDPGIAASGRSGVLMYRTSADCGRGSRISRELRSKAA
jgi:hypothetical protein